MYLKARAESEFTAPSIYTLVAEHKYLQKRIFENVLQKSGKHFEKDCTVRTDKLSAHVDYLITGEEGIHAYNIVSKAISSTDELVTKKGEPNFENKNDFLRIAIAQKILLEQNSGKNVRTYLIYLANGQIAGLGEAKFLELDKQVWMLEGSLPESNHTALLQVPVTDICNKYLNGTILINKKPLVQILDGCHQTLNAKDTPAFTLTHNCATCEFKQRCITEKFPKYSGESTVFDLNNFNYKTKNSLLANGVLTLSDIPSDTKLTDRQHVQVAKASINDKTPFFNSVAYADAISGIQYPLHCIDFETANFPIAPYKNTPVMTGVTYQYSHHKLDKELNIVGYTAALETSNDENPTLNIIRKLYKDLKDDNGTVVIYSQHENTYLGFAIEELIRSEAADKEELLTFLKTLYNPTDDFLQRTGLEAWEPTRPMLDLLEVVKSSYYQINMGGSNSIKYVLPSVLLSIPDLQCNWIYGYNGEFLHNQQILSIENGRITSPYDLLPKGEVNITKGDIALELYTELVYTHISDERKAQICKALQQYCELDTLAEVIILQGLHILYNQNKEEF